MDIMCDINKTAKVPRVYNEDFVKFIRSDGSCFELFNKLESEGTGRLHGNFQQNTKFMSGYLGVDTKQLFYRKGGYAQDIVIEDFEISCAYELYFHYGNINSSAGWKYLLEFNGDGVFRSLDNAFANNLIKNRPLVTVSNHQSYTPYPVENMYTSASRPTGYGYPSAKCIFIPSDGSKLTKVKVDISGTVSSQHNDAFEINRLNNIVDIKLRSEYVEPEINYDILTEGLVIHLDGRDKVANNILTDKVSGIPFTALDITHKENSYEFNGTTSSLYAENVTLDRTEYTAIFKIKYDVTDTTARTIFAHRTNYDNNGIMMFFQNSKLYINAVNSTGEVITTFTPRDKDFIHIAYIFNSTTNKVILYINGRLWNTYNSTVDGSSVVDTLILFNEFNNGVNQYHLKGELGSFKWYSKELSGMEIYSDYMYEKSIIRGYDGELITDGLICQLDGRDGSNEDKTAIWEDRSGNGNDIILNGLSYNAESGWNNGSVCFDGIKDFGECVKSLNTNIKTILYKRSVGYINGGASISIREIDNIEFDYDILLDYGISNNEYSNYSHHYTGSKVPSSFKNQCVLAMIRGDKNKLYRDNILTNEWDVSTEFKGINTSMTIGTFREKFISIKIQDILIYDRVLTPLEIEKVTNYLNGDKEPPLKDFCIGQYNASLGSNLDKTAILEEVNKNKNDLAISNLNYNIESGFYMNRLFLDGINDSIQMVEGYVCHIAFALRDFSVADGIGCIIDTMNSQEHISLNVDNTGLISWENLKGLYINGEVQEITGTMQKVADVHYVFNLNIENVELSQVCVARNLEGLNLLKCEIEQIEFYTRVLDKNEISIMYRRLKSSLDKEYIIKEKYLIEDGDRIKRMVSSITTPTLNTIPIRYIRDYLNGSSANTSCHWVEIKANKGNGNVALGKQVISSGSDEGSAIEVITDGSTATASYYGLNGGVNVYVQVDLGTPQLIDNVQIWHYYGDSRTYYDTKTEVSTDGIKWYTLYDAEIDGNYAETSSGKTYDLSKYKIENIGDIEIIDVGAKEDLTLETFERYGVDKATMEYINLARASLLSDEPKIIFINKELIHNTIREFGTYKGEIIEMKRFADLSPEYVQYVRNIDITANSGNANDVLKFIVSNNDGFTWWTYHEGTWIEVIKNNGIIVEKGMTLNEINNLTEAQLQVVSENVDSFKIAWYMFKDSMVSSLEITHIHMDYKTNL